MCLYVEFFDTSNWEGMQIPGDGAYVPRVCYTRGKPTALTSNSIVYCQANQVVNVSGDGPTDIDWKFD